MKMRKTALFTLLSLSLVLLASSGRLAARELAFTVYGEAEGGDYFLSCSFREPFDESVLFFDLKDGGNYRAVHLWEGRLFLEEYRNSERRILAEAELASDKPAELLLKRHSDYVAAAVDGTVLLSAPIRGALGASFGVGSCGKGGFVFRRYRPQGEIYFTDSFMRAGEAGEWEVVSGWWEIVGLSFAERSTNPFSLFCRFDDSARLGTLEEGRLLEERVGIGVNMSPQGNIVRISGGAPAAEAGLQQGDRILEVNGKPVYFLWRRLEHASPGEQFRLKVRRGRRIFTVTVKARRYRWGKIEKHYPVRPARISKEALILSGYPFWDDYTFRASVRPAGEGAVGLVFYWRGPGDYFALRWYGDNSVRGGKTNRVELVEVSGGRERVLASRDGGFFSDQFYELKVAVLKRSLSVFIDDYELFRLKSDRLTAGRFGLWASDGYGAWFDDVKVMATRSFFEEPPRRRVNPVYRKQADMKQWSDPSRDWKVSWYGKSLLAQYRYRCYGGAEVKVDPRALRKSAPVVVYGFCDRNRRGGVTVSVGDGDLIVSLPRRMVKKTLPPMPEDEPLRFRFDRNEFTLLYGDKPVQRVPIDPGEAEGDYFAVSGLRRFQSGDELLVHLTERGGVRDYTFERSPVDWFIMDGKWAVVNKWICDPRWSWFGGRNLHGLAAITTRYAVEGDFSLDLFFATMMMVNDPPYEMLGNYCFTVCGDGADISDGYTFFIGGGMNEWIGVSRGDDILKRNHRDGRYYSFLPVDNRLEFLSNDVVHQRWYHVKIEREGNTLSFWFEGKKYYSFTDPDPLPGGHITLWTYRNGMMLSRVRVAAEKFVSAPPRFCFERHVNTPHWTDEGARRSRLVVETDKPRTGFLTATVAEVGPCALVSTLPPLDPLATPELSLEAALSPGTRADLFFDYEDVTYRIRLTGPPDDDPAVPTIGEVELPDDGNVHDLLIPLGRMLSAYLGARRLTSEVKRLRIGRLTAGGYAFAGFGGHGPGGRIVLGPLRPIVPSKKCLEAVEPFPDGACLVRFRLKKGCPPLDVRDASLRVNGVEVATGADASLSPDGRCLDVEVRRTLGLKNGDEVSVVLSGLRTASGEPLSPWSLEGFRYAAAEDRTPPRLLDDWVFDEPALFLDFESPFPPDPSPGSRKLSGTFFAGYQRDTTSASWNRSSLKVFSNHIGSVMFHRLTTRKIDLNATPVISFDYRMDRSVPLSFVLGDYRYCILFNDKAPSGVWSWESGKRALTAKSGVVGDFGKPVCDGRWHHAWFVFDGSRSVRPVSGIALGDAGFRGTYLNDWMNLDNFRVSALVDMPSAPPRLRFAETGGVAKIYTSVSAEPETPSGLWKPSDGFPPGVRFYFNVMAEDEAGNRSPVTHIPFFSDRMPPAVTRVFWRRKGLSIGLKDISGIDRSSLVFTSGDYTVRGDDSSVFWSKYGVSFSLPPEVAARREGTLTVRDGRGNEAVYRIIKSKAVPAGKEKERNEI